MNVQEWTIEDLYPDETKRFRSFEIGEGMDLQGEALDAHIANNAHKIKRLQAATKIRKEEIDRLKALNQIEENEVRKTRNYIAWLLTEKGIEKVKAKNIKVFLRKAKEKLVCDDSRVTPEYMEQVIKVDPRKIDQGLIEELLAQGVDLSFIEFELKVDKSKIEKSLREGIILDFAEIELGDPSIMIK